MHRFAADDHVFIPACSRGWGKIQIFDASTNQVVETIDVSQKTAIQSIGGMDRFTYFPVIISGNEADVYPRNQSLSYGKSYYLTIDPGVFKSANDWAGFSARRIGLSIRGAAGPAAGTTKLVVAADGSGDFCTVQGAVDFIPAKNRIPTTILVRKGTYTGIICISKKHAITIRGEDRKQTILTYLNNDRMSQKPDMKDYRRGVLTAAHCDDFHLSNLTIRNTTPARRLAGGDGYSCRKRDGSRDSDGPRPL